MGELIDKAKGKLKQAEGGLTGNRQEQVEGVIDEKKGQLKEGFERVKQAIRGPEKI